MMTGFPMLSHKGATALNSAGRQPLRGNVIPQQSEELLDDFARGTTLPRDQLRGGIALT
jgi:hypothetical protein